MAEFDSKEKIQANIEMSPFNSFCRIRVEELDRERGQLVLSMPMRAEMERIPDSGQMHGGPIACLVDTAGYYAAMMVLGFGGPTVNFRTDYFRPVIGSSLKAVATVRKAGRTVTVSDVDLFDDDGKLVAAGRATFSSRAG